MRRYTVRVDGTPFLVDVEETAADRFRVAVGDRTFTASLEAAEALPGSEIVPGVAVPAAPTPTPTGAPAPGAARTPPTQPAPPPPTMAPIPAQAPGVGSSVQGATIVAAPMPGVILEVQVAAGAPVTRGDPLLVLEAMKMRNIVRAPRAGVVAAVHVEPGRPVLPGEPMVTLDDAPR